MHVIFINLSVFGIDTEQFLTYLAQVKNTCIRLHCIQMKSSDLYYFLLFQKTSHLIQLSPAQVP